MRGECRKGKKKWGRNSTRIQGSRVGEAVIVTAKSDDDSKQPHTDTETHLPNGGLQAIGVWVFIEQEREGIVYTVILHSVRQDHIPLALLLLGIAAWS